MNEQPIRHLRATELKLLQERTKLQRKIDELLQTGAWKKSEVDELGQQQDRIEAELAELRAELRRLDRDGGLEEG
jgi:polyhydroxyalkanoate synthesis regulator phasin